MIARGENPAMAAAVQRTQMPYSVLRSSPAFVVLAVTVGCASNFADPDLWMHILVGRQILHTGHIPLRDFYSYSAAGLPWRNHEWLAEVTLAFAYDGLGILGLKLLKLLCMTIVVAALAVGLARAATPPVVQRVILVAAAVGTMAQIQFRPQLFTFAMLSILMAALAGEIYESRARLWPLIPMFAVWANLHGGFVLGVAALSVCTVTLAASELMARRRIVRAWRIALVTIACTLATLLNPLGIRLWPNVLHSVSDPLIRGFISDWLPLIQSIVYTRQTPFEDLQYVVPVLLFIGFLISLLISPTLDDAPLVGVAVLLIGAAFYSARNISVAVICLTIPFAHHLGLALQKPSWPEPEREFAGPSGLLLSMAALLIAMAGGEFSNRLKTWAPVPNGAVAFMKARNLHGNILNHFDWGEYLIWHGAPQDRVFVDGRCELVYPDRLLREYIEFLYGLPGGAKLLDSYPHNLILLRPDTRAYRTVAADSRWRLAYSDPDSALFVRASAKAPDSPDLKKRSSAPTFFP
jgi:hypothetical protein